MSGEVAKPGKNTFKIDMESSKSDWIYNQMYLGINCGEKCGFIYVDAMGGYGKDKENKIYVHGKDEEGHDDFQNRFEIAWEDRKDEELLKSVGNLCFFRAEIKKDDKGNIVKEHFLSAYDFIQYLGENLEEGMKVSVTGNLKYQIRNGNVQVQKNITGVYLADYLDSPTKYTATFKQAILFDKDCLDLKEYDNDKGCLLIPGYCVDYLKDYNGVEIKSNYPYKVDFEYEIDKKANPEQYIKKCNALFKVKKDIDEIVFNGEFREGGATVQATYDDLEEDIKHMVNLDIIPLEEALSRCSASSSRERRMVLVMPNIKKVTKGDVTSNVLEIYRGKYEEEDLEFVLPSTEEETEEVEMNTVEPISEEEDADLAAILAEMGAE